MSEHDISDPAIRDEPFEPASTDSSVVYNGAVWNLRRDVVGYGDGTMVREYVDHTGAVAIFAEDDEGRVLLIQQYRHPIRRREWELPAGLLDKPGEDPLEAAKRELAEEADMRADHWHSVIQFVPSAGGSNERIELFRARGLHAVPERFEREDEEADIVIRWVPREEIVRAALEGRIANSALLIGALAVEAFERRR